MSDQLQYTLFRDTLEQQFDAWVHTPEDGEVANMFIRIAIGVNRRSKRVGAKMICERIRWNMALKHDKGEGWKINNNWTAYLARFAMQRAPELRGFFRTREIGKKAKPSKVYVVEPKTRTA